MFKARLIIAAVVVGRSTREVARDSGLPHAFRTADPSGSLLGREEGAWQAAPDLAKTVEELQRQLDRFGRHYNTVRPHRALHRKTPAEAYAARPKAIPNGAAIKPHHRVRYDVVDAILSRWRVPATWGG